MGSYEDDYMRQSFDKEHLDDSHRGLLKGQDGQEKSRDGDIDWESKSEIDDD